MSIAITSWLRAFFALQTEAMESRGFVEVKGGDEEVARWPRTTGADVIAIAAVVDPYVRAAPLRFGGHGVARRWRAVADELEAALDAPADEYVGNRMFWRTLPAVSVYLHAQGAELPPEHVWQALLAQLAVPAELRNAGPRGDGPFKHFDGVKTFDDLYIAQFTYLRDLRGFDKAGDKVIPRTTNGDVVALADYWSKQLADAKHVMGHDGVVATWKAALADVDQVARKSDPNGIYPKNDTFWRALAPTAIQVAVADEAPSSSDLALAALKDSLTHLPENVKAGASAVATAVGEVAHGVGKVASEAGKGLFAGFGTPLLVGAGLVGLFLISRSKRQEA